jgi:hypothetical protein
MALFITCCTLIAVELAVAIVGVMVLSEPVW